MEAFTGLLGGVKEILLNTKDTNDGDAKPKPTIMPDQKAQGRAVIAIELVRKGKHIIKINNKINICKWASCIFFTISFAAAVSAIACNKFLSSTKKYYTTLALAAFAPTMFSIFLIISVCITVLKKQIDKDIEDFFNKTMTYNADLCESVTDDDITSLKLTIYVLRIRKICLNLGGVLFLFGCAFIALYILCKKFLSQDYSRNIHITKSCLAALIITFSIGAILLSVAGFVTLLKDHKLFDMLSEKCYEECREDDTMKENPLFAYVAVGLMESYSKDLFDKLFNIMEDHLTHVLKLTNKFQDANKKIKNNQANTNMEGASEQNVKTGQARKY